VTRHSIEVTAAFVYIIEENIDHCKPHHSVTEECIIAWFDSVNVNHHTSQAPLQLMYHWTLITWRLFNHTLPRSGLIGTESHESSTLWREKLPMHVVRDSKKPSSHRRQAISVTKATFNVTTSRRSPCVRREQSNMDYMSARHYSNASSTEANILFPWRSTRERGLQADFRNATYTAYA